MFMVKQHQILLLEVTWRPLCNIFLIWAVEVGIEIQLYVLYELHIIILRGPLIISILWVSFHNLGCLNMTSTALSALKQLHFLSSKHKKWLIALKRISKVVRFLFQGKKNYCEIYWYTYFSLNCNQSNTSKIWGWFCIQGIPEQADVPPVAQLPASGQTVNLSTQATQPLAVPSGGPNSNPLDLFPQVRIGMKYKSISFEINEQNISHKEGKYIVLILWTRVFRVWAPMQVGGAP